MKKLYLRRIALTIAIAVLLPLTGIAEDKLNVNCSA